MTRLLLNCSCAAYFAPSASLRSTQRLHPADSRHSCKRGRGLPVPLGEHLLLFMFNFSSEQDVHPRQLKHRRRLPVPLGECCVYSTVAMLLPEICSVGCNAFNYGAVYSRVVGFSSRIELGRDQCNFSNQHPKHECPLNLTHLRRLC